MKPGLARQKANGSHQKGHRRIAKACGKMEEAHSISSSTFNPDFLKI